jgi:hypothetical protein
MDYVKLQLNVNRPMKTEIAHVTGLGKQDLILGQPWLQDWNPDVDWKLGSLKWRDTVEGTEKTPADEPTKLKYWGRKPEELETAAVCKDSGDRPRTCCKPTIMALSFQDKPIE